jgi:hypothetical protein
MAVAGKPAGKAGRGWVKVDIERLVTWALRDQGLGWVGGDTFSPVAEMMALGTIVDTSHTGSHPTIGLLDSDDALAVKAAIEALPVAAGALLVRYGRAGLRPEWGEGAYEQETDAAGRLRWDWDDPVNRTGARRPHMVFVGTDPAVIEAERAEYALWRQGLVDIIEPLNAVMTEHEATGPAVLAEPWLATRPVVHGLSELVVPAKVSDEPGSAKIARAQAPVRARASDWSVRK